METVNYHALPVCCSIFAVLKTKQDGMGVPDLQHRFGFADMHELKLQLGPFTDTGEIV